jgi:hypothetical protein
VVRVPVVTVAVTVAAPVPEAELSDNQAALSFALQVKEPPPVFVIVKDCGDGLLPPCWAVNDRLAGLSPMAGGTGAAVTVKDTGTVTDAVPGALRVMIPL